MLFIIKIFVLVALIRLLLATDKPFLCSGIYAGFAFLFAFAFTSHASAAAVAAGIGFVLSSIYFWILNRLDSSSATWWIVAVLGIVIGVV